MSCLMPYITHRVFTLSAQERCRSDIQWRISRTSVEEYPAVESEVKHQLDHHEAAAFSALPVTTWSPQSGLSHSDTGKLYRQVLEDFKSTWNDMMTGICWGNYYSFPLWLTFRNNYWQENWRLYKVWYSLIPEKLKKRDLWEGYVHVLIYNLIYSPQGCDSMDRQNQAGVSLRVKVHRHGACSVHVMSLISLSVTFNCNLFTFH